MRNIVLAAVLLLLGSFQLAGQDVIVSGSADFKRLCEGNMLPKKEGWTVVSKNVAIPGVSPEIWCGIARIRKSGSDFIATLAYGPVRCDRMWFLSKGLVIYNKGSKYSAVCLVDGKWKQTLKGYNCEAIPLGHANGAKAQLLARGKDGFYSWIDEAGKHLAGTPDHYDNTVLYSRNNEVAAVKTGGKWGAVSSDARVVIPIQYDTVSLTAPLRQWGGKWASANWFYVNKKGLWGVRGDNGVEAVPPVYSGLSYWPKAPDSWCYRKPGGKWGMRESGGKQILPEDYDGLSACPSQSSRGAERAVRSSITKETNSSRTWRMRTCSTCW